MEGKRSNFAKQVIYQLTTQRIYTVKGKLHESFKGNNFH